MASANTLPSGFGCQPCTVPVQLTENAPGTISDNGIQSWLAGKLNSNDPAFPAPDKNTLYALNYPTGTTITLPAKRRQKEAAPELAAPAAPEERKRSSDAPGPDELHGLTARDLVTALNVLLDNGRVATGDVAGIDVTLATMGNCTASTSAKNAAGYRCKPHSVLSLPAQRPERGSAPGSTGWVQGWQPIDR